MSPGAGRRERGRDFAADQPGFAHSGDDDAAGTLSEQIDGATKLFVQPGRHTQERAGLVVNDLPSFAKQLELAERNDGTLSDRTHSRRP